MVVGDQQADFEEARAGIEQSRDALARGEFAGAMLLLDALRAAAFAQTGLQGVQLLDEMAHVRHAGRGLRRVRALEDMQYLVAQRRPAAPCHHRSRRVDHRFCVVCPRRLCDGLRYQYSFSAICISRGEFDWPLTMPNALLFKFVFGLENTVRLNRLNASARKSSRKRSVKANDLPRLDVLVQVRESRAPAD